MNTTNIKTALKAGWDAMSPSYQADSHIALDDVHYAPFAPGETFYRLMGDVSGKRILELACGAAQNSVALSNWGAQVTALDFSPNQLNRALANKRQTNTNFHLIAGDMESPTMFKPGSFDIILSSFGWEFIPDLPACLSACAQILRPSGQLIMSTVHPLSAFSWDIRDQSLRVTDYFNPPTEVWDDPVPEGYAPGLTFFRTIEDLTTSLTSAGLQIDRLIEPYPRLPARRRPIPLRRPLLVRPPNPPNPNPLRHPNLHPQTPRHSCVGRNPYQTIRANNRHPHTKPPYTPTRRGNPRGCPPTPTTISPNHQPTHTRHSCVGRNPYQTTRALNYLPHTQIPQLRNRPATD